MHNYKPFVHWGGYVQGIHSMITGAARRKGPPPIRESSVSGFAGEPARERATAGGGV
jgi:hypothetical protein